MNRSQLTMFQKNYTCRCSTQLYATTKSFLILCEVFFFTYSTAYNLGGEIINLREARKRAAKTKRVAMVEFGNGRALDASIKPNKLCYVNHSCRTNTYMRICYSRVEFYSLRTINKGEELTCNYAGTHRDGKLKCR